MVSLWLTPCGTSWFWLPRRSTTCLPLKDSIRPHKRSASNGPTTSSRTRVISPTLSSQVRFWWRHVFAVLRVFGLNIVLAIPVHVVLRLTATRALAAQALRTHIGMETTMLNTRYLYVDAASTGFEVGGHRRDRTEGRAEHGELPELSNTEHHRDQSARMQSFKARCVVRY